MKKLFAGLFLMGIPAWASFQPITGSSITVNPLMVGGSAVSASNPLPVQSTGATTVNGAVTISGSISNTSFNEYQTNPSTSQLRVSDLSGNPVNVGWAASVSSPVPVALILTSSQPAITIVSTGIAISGNVGQSGSFVVTAGTGAWSVTGSTVGAVASFATFSGNVSSSVVRLADQSGSGITSTSNALDLNLKSLGGTSLSGSNVVDTGNTALRVNVVAGGGAGGGTSSSFAATFPSAGTAAGFVNPSGTMQAARVDTSSAVWVNLEFSTFTGTLSNNNATATTNRIGTLPAIAQNQAGNNGSSYTQGRDAALNVGALDGNLEVTSGFNLTYANFAASTPTFSVANSTSDFTWMCGNAKSTITVTSLMMTCTQTTAGIIPVAVAKRSTAYTFTGQISTITAVAMDSNFTTTNSTANFTTNQNLTNGTIVGYLDNANIGCMATGTTSPNDVYVNPSTWAYDPPILRKPGECVGVNIQGASFSGGRFSVRWTWRDGNTP